MTQVKQRPGESPLDYAECFHASYENYCAVNNIPEGYDSACVNLPQVDCQNSTYICLFLALFTFQVGTDCFSGVL